MENGTHESNKPEITFTYGKVSLSLFRKLDPERGEYLQPGSPGYRYKDETGKTAFSEYLRGWHCMDASLCYADAYRYIEKWKRQQNGNAVFTDTTNA